MHLLVFLLFSNIGPGSYILSFTLLYATSQDGDHEASVKALKPSALADTELDAVVLEEDDDDQSAVSGNAASSSFISCTYFAIMNIIPNFF